MIELLRVSFRKLDLNRLFACLCLLVSLLGLIGVSRPFVVPTAYEHSSTEVVRAFHSRQDNGLRLAKQHLIQFPNDFLITAIAAEFEVRSNHTESAIRYFKRLPQDGGRFEFIRCEGLSKQYQIQAKFGDVEAQLNRALQIYPYNIAVCERIGHLLQAEGRVWEAAPYFLIQTRRGKCRGDELLPIACVERFFRSDERLSQLGLRDNYPDSPMRVALARKHLFENRGEAAETCFRELLEFKPQLGEAQGRLGRILVDRNDVLAFQDWLRELPDAARQHPEVWLAQGLQARRLQMIEGAAFCFCQVLKLSPNHIAASLQLAQCLEQLGHDSAAEAMARRGKLLGEVDSTLNLLRDNPTTSLIRKTIGLMDQLERYWEAAGWCQVLSHACDPQSIYEIASARSEMTRYVNKDKKQSLQSPLLERLRIPEFVPPNWSNITSELPENHQSSATDDNENWSFSNDAHRVGIDFQYYEGTTEATRMQHIFNTMGGGLGVVDFDLDHWPDLHLAQANNWRELTSQNQHYDRLYRNRDGQRFDDVTLIAGTGDLGFTHGVNVGDYDSDGFPDIYVGNLGGNRLYHNNGDGTFNDVTEQAQVAGNEWTTSSVWVDLTEDGLPDLYVLNYSKLEMTRDKECQQNGVPVACTPDLLVPEVGKLYINQGNGIFRDATNDLMPPLPAGRGLGVVAWSFSPSGRPELFLGNDTMANSLLIHHGLDASGNPKLVDEAVIRGVALDVDGNAQASMGIAAGDANGDGNIDLFITTFFGESNTFYSLRKDGYFEDLTRSLKLREPSFWMLGFGSQFGDFNNDGWPDLVVTNGHVDQKSKRGDPDRMRPQLFGNRNGRTFEEVKADSLGTFFQERYLGRGLATLDWNRDGKLDFAVSHLHGPLALVTNNTTNKSAPLSIRLIGITHRVPQCVSVQLKFGSRTQTVLATLGDGFLVSNERHLRFSIPENETEIELTIRWLSGKTQSHKLRTGADFITVIEGDPQIWDQTHDQDK